MYWWRGRRAALSGHETYSVLTRLPGDVRVAQADAARLLTDRFDDPLLTGSAIAGRIHDVLGGLQIASGAVYDALVALAAVEHDAPLATRDERARATYEIVGAHVVVVT